MKFTDIVPNLIVSDVQRSMAFYRDVLGFDLVATVPDAPPFAFAWLRRDAAAVFLNSRESIELADLASRPVGGTATLYVTLEAEGAENGVDALFQQLDGRAPVVMPLTTQFYGMREFAVADPDGYVIFFGQQVS